MGDIFNEDFQDFLKALLKANVDFILVGGYAVILHGYSRTTGDMDVWVDRTQTNYKKLTLAFQYFGMPVFDMTEGKFLDVKNFDVFSFGVEPRQIDILTKVKGLNFKESFGNAKLIDVEGIPLNMLSREDLILAKRAAGRHRDLDDIENLESE